MAESFPLLSSLRIVNFKAFQDSTIPLRPLTLLSGLNGMGKSTVLQSLLLLRQSHLQGVLADGLRLNGELIEVGFAPDAKYEGAGTTDDISFGLGFTDGRSASWSFNANTDSTTGSGQRRVEQIDLLALTGNEDTTVSGAESAPLFTNAFHYLQAERIGPRMSSALSDSAVRRRQIGSRGEYAFHFLSRYSQESVLSQLHHPTTLNSTDSTVAKMLSTQVEAWMQEFSPGSRLKVEPYPELAAMRVSFQVDRGNEISREFRPVNYGFGVTYSLPVLVAILSAQPGTLILLENPEAHLHPRGHSVMGDLLARAASAGIQILVETHSDHILNGIRVAARKNLVNANDVALHFFQRRENSEPGSMFVSPQLTQNGRLDFWPDGFFDEWDNSLDALM